jgi:Cu/Ag efflux protein CusF
MKLPRLLALILALALPGALFAAGKNCGCACCKGKDVCCCSADEEAAEPELAKGFHHLTGVVTAVMSDRQALMVKHDDIPGVMRAMTMMFLVEADVIDSVKKGDAIKAHIGRDENNKWILRHVQVVTPAR